MRSSSPSRAGWSDRHPVGSDTRLLGIGMAIEAVLGRLPAPAI